MTAELSASTMRANRSPKSLYPKRSVFSNPSSGPMSSHVQRSDKSTAPVEDSDGGIPADRTSRPGAPARNRMPAPLNDAGRADPTDPGSEQRLLNQVRRGSASAVAALFERYAPWLRRRARGRLPQWARSGGGGDQRSGAGRAASHLRPAHLVRVEARQRLARLSPARRGEPRPGRAAPGHPPSGHRPPRPWGGPPAALRGRGATVSATPAGGAVGALPGRPEAPEGPRSPADRRPGGTGAQLRAARRHRTPPESGRRAQGAQAGRHSAERGHAAGLQPVASRAPARPGGRRRPPVRNPSGSGHPDVIRDILRWPRPVRAGWRCAVGCRLCDAHRRP